jgi:methylenetetrahydrofolate dehydrogenase (NADP+)/methenyltetrahydrofolate cyclohydrolase
MILDGKKIAREIYKELEKKIKQLETPPTLGAVLVWENSASLRYIRQKQKFSEKIGMWFQLFHFPKDISEEALLTEIHALNQSKKISGYIVQLPLPKHIDALTIIWNIDPKKDVDGFHPENQWKVMIHDPSGFVPCTPAGVMKLFESYHISFIGKKVVILGRSNIVGKPLTILCINAGATVISCNSKTPDISVYTKDADIVICATGQAHLLKADMTSPHTVIIDVWFSIQDEIIYGDADTQGFITQWNPITPVPGGVGPLTVAMLLSNTLLAHSKH